MRIRVILDDSFVHGIHPAAEVLGSPDGSVTAVVWQINPNIPIGSPVHLEKLSAMLTLGDAMSEATELALFSVTWLNTVEWQTGLFIDPAKTAYALQLREESSILLTRDPYSIMLAHYLVQQSGGAIMDPLLTASEEPNFFWAPLSTAALSLEGIWGDDDKESNQATSGSGPIALQSLGGTKRRVWKRHGDDIWALRGCVAVFGYPAATTSSTSTNTAPQSTTGNALLLKKLPIQQSHVVALHKSLSSRRSFQWTFRVGYRDPTSTVASLGGKSTATVGRDDGGAVIYGDSYFVREDGKQRGNSTMAPTQNRSGGRGGGGQQEDSSDLSDDDEGDDVEEEQKIGVPLPSLFLGFALRQALEDAECEAAEGARMKSNPQSNPQSGSRTPRTPRAAGTDGPSSPAGRAGGVVVFDDASQAASASPPPVARKVFELPAMFESCCLLDSITGRLHLGSSSREGARAIYADLDTYVCRNGMMLSFAVDMQEGIVNVRQDDRLVLVAALPSRLREELADAAAASDDGGSANNSLGGGAAWNRIVAPVVQIGTKGVFVDIF
ncbi:Hypothetical protein, putative [Bodo saltans]|uniref:Uncharacterized protein n=1 Tax=Bodo saltans TaxID=75058 RepID=A0A0S4J0R6_BODSA|nr:Hypothetical protein, putative [Bodo saltans]|eukprot:CUG39362.1 Hypothetical protein, putative [Bodo saltans]